MENNRAYSKLTASRYDCFLFILPPSATPPIIKKPQTDISKRPFFRISMTLSAPSPPPPPPRNRFMPRK